MIKPDDLLRFLDIGLRGRNEVGLVAVLPLDQEHQLSGRVGRAEDLLDGESAFESLLRSFDDFRSLRFRFRRFGFPFPASSPSVLALELLDEVEAFQVLQRLPGVVVVVVT